MIIDSFESKNNVNTLFRRCRDDVCMTTPHYDTLLVLFGANVFMRAFERKENTLSI